VCVCVYIYIQPLFYAVMVFLKSGLKCEMIYSSETRVSIVECGQAKDVKPRMKEGKLRSCVTARDIKIKGHKTGRAVCVCITCFNIHKVHKALCSMCFALFL
jgi:hypothetical protein